MWLHTRSRSGVNYREGNGSAHTHRCTKNLPFQSRRHTTGGTWENSIVCCSPLSFSPPLSSLSSSSLSLYLLFPPSYIYSSIWNVGCISYKYLIERKRRNDGLLLVASGLVFGLLCVIPFGIKIPLLWGNVLNLLSKSIMPGPAVFHKKHYEFIVNAGKPGILKNNGVWSEAHSWHGSACRTSGSQCSELKQTPH